MIRYVITEYYNRKNVYQYITLTATKKPKILILDFKNFKDYILKNINYVFFLFYHVYSCLFFNSIVLISQKMIFNVIFILHYS